MSKEVLKQVFLIELPSENERNRFLNEKKSGVLERCSWEDYWNDAEDVCHKYLIADPRGGLYWGSDSDIRPLGKNTGKLEIIGGGAISLDDYLRIFQEMRGADYKSLGEFIVKEDDRIVALLRKDKYLFLHRPYFAMKGSSHSLLTIYPSSQYAVDAGKIDEENISVEQFLALYKNAELNEISMCFEDFCARVKTANNCERLLYDITNGDVIGVRGRLSGVLKIPFGVKRIAEKSFFEQKYITDVMLPTSLVTIGREAFADCVSINRIYVPETVLQIHKLAFSKAKIIDIYYGGSEERWNELKGKNPQTHKGERNGYADFGNGRLLDAPNIHFNCHIDENEIFGEDRLNMIKKIIGLLKYKINNVDSEG